MNTEKIYELLNGKALSILEKQPQEIITCQNELDFIINMLRQTLSNDQLKLLDSIINKYSELITISDNFHFECGIKIGEKIARIL